MASDPCPYCLFGNNFSSLHPYWIRHTHRNSSLKCLREIDNTWYFSLSLSLSIFLLMAENYMPVYTHAFTCIHIFIRNFDTFKSCSFQLENIDWLASDTVSSTPTRCCVSPWTHFFFHCKLQKFWYVQNNDFWLFFFFFTLHHQTHSYISDHQTTSGQPIPIVTAGISVIMIVITWEISWNQWGMTSCRYNSPCYL